VKSAPGERCKELRRRRRRSSRPGPKNIPLFLNYYLITSFFS